MDRLNFQPFANLRKRNSWRLACIFSLIIATLILPTHCHQSATGNKNNEHSNELPFCRPNVDDEHSKSMIVVSTLDGHVTALDTLKGDVLWSLDTEPGDLLASTISNHEFSNQGKLSRLVPSLNGDLFTFDGESMDAVPISADSLLTNSIKMSDDTVVVGGKLIEVLGVNSATGELLYSCGLEKCKYFDNVIQRSNDRILLIRRMTRTVRALSLSSGTEKWNYSVGQHEVSLPAPSAEEGCHQYTPQANTEDHHHHQALYNFSVRFTPSDGLIYMLDSNKAGQIIWKHKFLSPIVHSWNVTGGKVHLFDLFDCEYNSMFSNQRQSEETPKPVLFLGMYNKQLYVTQSKQLDSLPIEYRNFGVDLHSSPPKVTWKPYLLTSHSRTPLIMGNMPSDGELVNYVKGEGENTALVIGHNGLEYPFENGFYLFSNQNSPYKPPNINSVNFTQDESIDLIIVSLWYWWKEVLAISVTLAIALNIIYAKFVKIHQKCVKEVEHQVKVELQLTVPVPVPVPSEPETKQLVTQSSSASSAQLETPPAKFESRYMTDFEPLELLGKGGFGTVFRARNKIDDCEYAIKRIVMPKNQDAKERILREVKTLAKLDHGGIVRYYNSWLECPPIDWKGSLGDIAESLTTPTTSLTLDDLQLMYDTRAKKNKKDDCHLDPTSSQLSSSIFNNNNDTSSFDLENQIPESTDKEDSASLDSDSEPRLPAAINEASGDSFIVFESGGKSTSNTRDESQSRSTSKSALHLVIPPKKNEEAKKENESDGLPVWAKPTRTLLYIQMQLCRKDSLKDWLTENDEFRNKIEVLDLFYQIVAAVEYVHDQGLMHRDLKPSNIFFALDGSIKVGDFGLVANLVPDQNEEISEKNGVVENGVCTQASFRHTNQVGTTLYMSPEQIAGDKYDHKVDIFSLGLVFFELLVPFRTAMERIQTMKDARELKFCADFVQESTSEHELVKQMLERNPCQRPSAGEILSHSLLEDFQMKPDRFRRRARTMSRTYSASSNGSSGQGSGSSGNDAQQ